MNSRGQFMPPFFKWIFGLIMIFTLAVIYYFFQPIMFSSMSSLGGLTVSSETGDIITSFQNNWSLAMTILVFGFGFYIFLSGLPGQTEENPF